MARAAPMPSAMSRKPGPEVAVMALWPLRDAPIRYCRAVISSVVGKPTPALIISVKMPEAGVMG
jgi:hypothetical protein